MGDRLKSKLFRVRCSLATALWMTAIIAIALGWLVDHWQSHRQLRRLWHIRQVMV